MLWLRPRERTASWRRWCARENPRRSPYGFELDSKSLLATNELDDEGYEVGIYHSHPRSPAEPSQTDINLAHYPHWTYLIVSLADDEPVVRGVADRGRAGRPRRRSSLDHEGASEPLACPSCAPPLLARGALLRDLQDAAGLRRRRSHRGAASSDAHERARKINPVYAEGELVRVAGSRNQAEAELIQGLLLEEGVPSILQPHRRVRRAGHAGRGSARRPRAAGGGRGRARGAARGGHGAARAIAGTGSGTAHATRLAAAILGGGPAHRAGRLGAAAARRLT